MNFPQVITNPCLPTTSHPGGSAGGPPVDQRCSDPQFALANPDLCQGQQVLLLKPGVALACVLGSVQLQAFASNNGVETLLDENSGVLFSSSNNSVALVGAISGNVTGVAAGSAVITAAYQGLTASCDLTILAGSGGSCCAAIEVATVLVVDVSLSMSLPFGAPYALKQDFADQVAEAYAVQTNATKGDVVGLVKFSSTAATVASVGTAPATVASEAAGLTNTQNLTGLGLALQQAVNLLATVSAQVKVILLVSDGEDKDTAAANAPLPIVEAFQQLGGIVLCVGVRAHDAGFNLLNGLATGGFFINAYAANAAAALQEVVSLKGYLCGGQCVPPGDTFAPTGKFNYTGFANWNVTQGCVDLKGTGFYDALPGNGLYVDMCGTQPCSPLAGQLTSKQTFNFVAGKTYRISFSLAGNNTAPQNGDALNVALGVLFNQTVNVPNYAQNFQTVSFNFTPQVSAAAALVFTGISGSATQFGVLLDNIVLADVSDLTTLLADNFDNENLTYVPPACGASQATGTGPNLIPNGAIYTFSGGNLHYTLSGLTAGATYAYVPDAFFGNSELINGSDTYTSAQNFVAAGTSVVLEVPGSGPGVFNVGGSVAAVVPLYFGYSCYGYGCLSQPPGTQTPDPNPLGDIEGGTVGPGSYSSTQTACASCPPGSENITGLVPLMTAVNVPAGTVVSNVPGTANPAPFQVFAGAPGWISPLTPPGANLWVGYQFPAATLVFGYQVVTQTGQPAPSTWTFEGSPDGVTWTTLDTQTGITWNSTTRSFFFANSTAYGFYRLNITAATVRVAGAFQPVALSKLLFALQYFGAGATQACQTATATSTLSQQDAVSKAQALALSNATGELQCQSVYTSHQSYTAQCPCGTMDSNYPNGATASASYVSFLSQHDADTQAQLLACAAAVALLSCVGSNNTQAIAINDSPRFGVGQGQAPATPYPSVQFVTGKTGVVTRLQVTLNGFGHVRPSDVFIVLVSPTGRTVVLMGGCGASNSVSGLTLVFDSQGNPPALPQNSALTSGTFAPTLFGSGLLYNCTNAPGCPPGTPTAFPAGPPYGSTFAAMIGDQPNGSWSLWIVDLLALDAGQIAGGWSINVTSA